MTAIKKIDISSLDNIDTASLIDELGNLQATIKHYEAREAKLAAAIKARLATEAEYNGAFFCAKTTAVSTTKLDTKKAKEFIEKTVDKEFLDAFFATSTSTRLTISILPVWASAAE